MLMEHVRCLKGIGGLVAVLLLTVACAPEGQSEQSVENPPEIPIFLVDPFWPLELPNNWILGEVAGVSIDEIDHVWIIHRPRTLDARERGEEGMCCVPAPPVIEFGPEGNVLRSWGGPGAGFEWPQNEHGIRIDHEGNVWIGGNGEGDAQVLKFTKDGEFLMQIGRAGQSGGSNDPLNLGQPASITIDPVENEAYIADGYGNRRVVVYDSRTGDYKRHWGAYGEPPNDAALPPYDPDAEPIRQFRSPVHGVAVSREGFVYVADRTNNRIQVFQKNGEFVKEAFVRPETRGAGTVCGLALSKDADQRWIFVPDSTNNVVWVLDRMTLEVVSNFGRLGKFAGQFYRLHDLDLDSSGNLYATEVNEGKRIQKFTRIGG